MQEAPVLIERIAGMATVILNRPRVLNTLNTETVRLLTQALEKARDDPGVRLVLLMGAGDRAFCAGGDLKELYEEVQAGDYRRALAFFPEEYGLDLMIHRYPKPVVMLAHGITMGGGLGLAAGADIVVATESTRMAMPETRIGFFPDVGATGWLFAKCPPGYPEYLSLTGYDMTAAECVRLGLATHLVPAARLPELRRRLADCAGDLSPWRREAAEQLRATVESFSENSIPARPEMDAWVAAHFAGRATVQEIIASLEQCGREDGRGAEVFQRLAERSPTAMVLTLKLLRRNEGRPLEEVFAREIRAGQFMIRQPDYLEGIRARLLDRDDQPRWHPATIEEVEVPEEI